MQLNWILHRGTPRRAAADRGSRMNGHARLVCEQLEPRRMLDVSPSVGGWVWHDLDRDSYRDDTEPPVAGLRVKAFDPGPNNTIGDADDVFVGEVVSGADGHYAFGDLPVPRTYAFQYTPPDGFSIGHTSGSISFDNRDSVVDPHSAAIRGLHFYDNRTVDYLGVGLETPPEFGTLTPLHVLSTSGNSTAKAVARDAADNYYVAGSLVGKIDFDPSLDALILDSGAQTHAFAAKYTPAGELAWAKSLGNSTGNGTVRGEGIAAAADGGVYLAGTFTGTVDFNPGAEADPRTSLGDADIFVAKFDAQGNYLWVRTAGNSGAEVFGDLVVDADGGAVIGGGFVGTVDFNPDAAATTNLISAGGQDAFVWKLSPTGALVWAKAYRGSGAGEMVNSVAIAPDGGVVSTGVYTSVTDFNPDAGIAPLGFATGGTDIFIAKLNANGSYAWARAISTIYGETGEDLAVDGTGNIYITGQFFESADFDPGNGQYILDSGGDYSLGQAFVLKLDSAGLFVWARSLVNRWAIVGRAITVDAAGNATIGGSYTRYFDDTLDYDPGPGEFRLPSSQGIHTYNAFDWRLNAAGEFVWARVHGNDFRDLTADDNGNVFVLTPFSGGVDVDPGPGLYSSLDQDDRDFVVTKYFPPAEVSGVAWNDVDQDGVRDENEPPLAGIPLRLWDSADGVIGNDNDGPAWPIVTTQADGSFRFRSMTPGIVYVQPDHVLGRRPTLSDQGTDETHDSDLLAGGQTATISLQSRDIHDDLGIGFVTTQPLPVADTFTTAEDTLLSIPGSGVLANDDHAAGPVSTTVLTGPRHGTLNLASDGGFTYQPQANFSGTDTFTYLAHQLNDEGLVFTREHRRYARDAATQLEELGRSVATSGDYAVSGASGDRNSFSSPFGTAYIYRWNGETWVEHTKLQGNRDTESFGTAVDISGDVMAITATAINSEIGGRVYVYRRNGTNWNLEATLAPSDPAAQTNFGRAVTISGDNLAVTINNAVYVFRRTGGSWAQQAKIATPPTAALGVVNSIVIDGDTLAIGNWTDSTRGNGAGAAYIYTRNGATWSQQATIYAPDASDRDEFGRSVGLQGNTLVVGAPQADEFLDSPGAVYVFEGSGATWTQVARLKADLNNNYSFGDAIDIRDDVIAVGSPNEGHTGAVYVYQRGDGSWRRQARLTPADTSSTSALYTGRSVDLGSHTVMAGSVKSGYFDNSNGALHFFEYARGGIATATINVTSVADVPAARNDVYAVPPDVPFAASIRGAAPEQYDAFVVTYSSIFRLPEGSTTPDVGQFLNYLDSSKSRGVAIDPVERKVYWTEPLANTIRRMNPDGSNIETVLSSVPNPRALAIDVVGRRMYWTNHDNYGIWRANLDGTGMTSFAPRERIGRSPGLAIDAAAGHLYYTQGDSIRRVNLDGTNSVDLINGGLSNAYGIALDLVERKMYWSEKNGRRIRRANLDGSGMETVMTFSSPISPLGLAIDEVDGKLYWSEEGSTNAEHRVMRANLDGSNVEVRQADGFLDASAIALFPVSLYSPPLLIPAGASWRYLDNGTAPSATWRQTAFDDSAWRYGYAELGFGDTADGRPEVTQLATGPTNNQYVTYYFRRMFSIADVSQFSRVRLDLKRDDGAVVYFNGQEVLRDNMPTGTIGNTTLSLGVASDDGADFIPFDLPTNGLVDGLNVVTVEIHQSARNSSDLSFDLRLTGIAPTPAVQGVLSNDVDPDSTLLAARLDGPYHGSLVFQPNGTFIYTPQPGFSGIDQFTYQTTDGATISPPALVTLNVAASNVLPLVADEEYVVVAGRTISITAAGGLLSNDFDLNGDALTATRLTSPGHGIAIVSPNGAFNYAPQASFVGIDSFDYRVSDGSGGSSTATAVIRVLPYRDLINTLPTARDDQFTLIGGGGDIIAPGVLANDRDAEGRPLFASLVSPPWHGLFSLAADGGFRYTPLPGFTGADSFTYRVTDGNSFSPVATVTLNVSAAAAPLPVVADPDAAVATRSRTPGATTGRRIVAPTAREQSIRLTTPRLAPRPRAVETDHVFAAGSPVVRSLTATRSTRSRCDATGGEEPKLDSFATDSWASRPQAD